MSIKTYLKRGISYILHGQPIVNNHITARIVQLSPSELLKGRTAFITGGTSGIGLAIAKAFIIAGAEDVIITGRNSERLKKACHEIQNATSNLSGNIHGIEMDINNVKNMDKMWKEALSCSQKNKIDIVVNNAGVLGSAFGNTTEEDYNMVMDTNLRGTYFLSQLVAHYMKDNNIKGNILNVASSSSLRPAASVYTLSKWGIRGLTMGMARVLTQYGITVNGIAPGPTATPMLQKERNGDSIFHPRSLTGRYATPEEIANLAVVLVSDMGKMIVGDIIYATGGAGVVTNEDVFFSFS
jgi:3-oxoacyl-[acyl-carrier protein] reductase